MSYLVFRISSRELYRSGRITALPVMSALRDQLATRHTKYDIRDTTDESLVVLHRLSGVVHAASGSDHAENEGGHEAEFRADVPSDITADGAATEGCKLDHVTSGCRC